jgi:hypothetical protein
MNLIPDSIFTKNVNHMVANHAFQIKINSSKIVFLDHSVYDSFQPFKLFGGYFTIRKSSFQVFHWV